MLFPLLALSLVLPEAFGRTALAAVFAVIFWPGPLFIAAAYLVIRAIRHRRMHRQFDPCPWCQREAEYHTVPQSARDARDRLRERLRRSEMHID